MLKAKILILILALIASCVPQNSHFTSTTTVSIVPTITPRSSAKPSETVTLPRTPTNTPTLVPSSTWTPLPTLAAEEKHAKIQELLETNNGCKLPCWWGISPGKTTWPEALHFLTPLVVNILEGHTSKSVQYEIDGVLDPESLQIGVQDNLVVWITTYQPESYYTYQLHQILVLLGIPEQVYISAQSSTGKFGAELPPAILFLDYSRAGVWATYGYLPTRVGENISICPQNFEKTTSIYELYRSVGGRLHLFDPKREYPEVGTIDVGMGRVWGIETIKKLEDATNMTIESFYESFIDPTSNACMETPANLWP